MIELLGTNTNKVIDEDFFRAFLSTDLVTAADFSTLKKHDIHMIGPDYHLFIYDFLWSMQITEALTYFYVILRVGDELTDCFYQSMVKDAIEDIQVWHKRQFPHKTRRPSVELIAFTCGRKTTDEAHHETT